MLPDDETLLLLAKSPETQNVERKKSVPKTDEIRRTLSAFANTTPEGQHSVLFLGITDDREIVGISDSVDSVQQTVAKIAAEDCYPPIKVDFRVIQPDGKDVIIVIVGFSKSRPHFTGHAYVRIGSETKRASDEQYNEFVFDRNDKVRRIRREKGKLISAHWDNSENDGAANGIKPFNDRDFKVADCDAFVLTLEETASQRMLSVPIELVTVSHDREKYRTLFLLKIPYPKIRPSPEAVMAGYARLVSGLAREKALRKLKR